eukprot:scaffold4372_cov397-Prasinococcus_capsulatus_cf.AAC.23
MIVQPYAEVEELVNADEAISKQAHTSLFKADEVARCEQCYGYINRFCQIARHVWRCSLCDHLNTFDEPRVERYSGNGGQTPRRHLPELRDGVVEMQLSEETPDELELDDVHSVPVYIAVVDLASNEEFLELVKSSLLAALEAMGPLARFGLITVSHKIGLYDVQGKVPVVRHISLNVAAGGEALVPLEDAMPLSVLLAPVAEFKENISAVLESLYPVSPVDNNGLAVGGGSNGNAGVDEPARALGAALKVIVQYGAGEGDEGTAFLNARLMCFLSGPPNCGFGRLDLSTAAGTKGSGVPGARQDKHSSTPQTLTPRSSMQQEEVVFHADLARQQVPITADDELRSADPHLLQPSSDAYRFLAQQALAVGFCVDLYIVSSAFVDLPTLQLLSLESGGDVFLYTDTEESTMPQDVYRCLSRPQAIAASLRIRTSLEFTAARAYGHFFPDPQMEGLHHILSCDQFASFAYDFEFKGRQSFSTDSECPPTIQVAFQYSKLIAVPAEGADKAGDQDETPATQRLVRRLRIFTMRTVVARSVRQVYESCRAEVVLSMLVHKIIRAIMEEGVEEGRLLLQDWLVILTANYNEQYRLLQAGNVSASKIDTSFSACDQLQPLPRLVFSLLRSDLLRLPREGASLDRRTHLHYLMSRLEPRFIQCLVGPLASRRGLAQSAFSLTCWLSASGLSGIVVLH